MNTKRLISYFVGMLLTGSIMAEAGAGARPPQGIEQQITTADVVAEALFNASERSVLSDYLDRCRGHYDESRCWDRDKLGEDKPGKKQKSLPPGLQKKLERGGELPPGWKMKVARGEVLSEDIYYNHARTLPEEILRRLPAAPDGTSIRRIDDRIVRLNDTTRAILDVLYLTGN